jgi:hypothetical protein
MASSSLFSVLQQVVMSEVKDRAATAREKFQAVTEKVMTEVVESQAFKKHVAFNIEERAQHQAVEVVSREQIDGLERMFAEAPREPIGYVSVFVSRVAGLKNSQPVYIEGQVEGLTLRTPASVNSQSFDFDKKMYDWEKKEHTLRFPVTDIKTGVAIRVISEGVLTNDHVLGQVLIPLERLLPKISEEFQSAFRQNMEDRESRFVEGPSVYELYPLPRSRTEFQPGVRDCARTGMSKPAEVLGYVRIRTEFVPNDAVTDRLWVCKAYFNTVPYLLKQKRTPLQNVNLDVARTQRHIQRQLKRLDAIFERIMFGPFAPTYPFSHARSWDSPTFSIIFTIIVASAILYLPAFMLPMFFLGIVCVGGYLSRDMGETKPVVWNEDIKDPDDSLNPMQRIAKLLWLLETISVQLVQYADFFERVIHACGFRDERVSFLVMLFMFFMTISLTALAFFIPMRTFVFLVFCAWMFSSIDFYQRYQVFKYHIKSGKTVPYHPRIQPLVNLMMRIPTTERLGHLSICEDQIIKNRAIVERVERIVVEDATDE